MAWLLYLSYFAAGLFLVNGIPHFVQGVSGNYFQSPFASPPGVGESPPVINVFWGLANFTIGLLLLLAFEKPDLSRWQDITPFVAGCLLAALITSFHFGRVRNNKV